MLDWTACGRDPGGCTNGFYGFLEGDVTVPNLADAKKRIKQDERRRGRNRARTKAIKTETRKVLDLLHDGKVDEAKKAFVVVTKKLDRVAAQKTLHANTVARRKSRLAKRIHAAAKSA